MGTLVIWSREIADCARTLQSEKMRGQRTCISGSGESISRAEAGTAPACTSAAAVAPSCETHLHSACIHASCLSFSAFGVIACTIGVAATQAEARDTCRRRSARG